MRKTFSKLFAPLAVFAMALGLSFSLINRSIDTVAHAADASLVFGYSAIKGNLTGSFTDKTSYWLVPAENSASSAEITLTSGFTNTPTGNVTVTFKLATFGSGSSPTSQNSTITVVGTETESNWTGSGVTAYPTSSTYVDGVMTLTKPATPTAFSGIKITIGVGSGVRSFRLSQITVAYAYGSPSVSVTGVSLDQSTMTLTAGGSTGTLVETVSPSNASNKSVTWQSDNTSVATVSAGVVTPVSQGTAIITVRTVDGNFPASATITVNYATLTSLTINLSEVDLIVGNTSQLSVNPVPSKANGAVNWSSNKENIATVNASGLVTGIAVGTATITATSVDNPTITISSTVTVSRVVGTTLNTSLAGNGNITNYSYTKDKEVKYSTDANKVFISTASQYASSVFYLGTNNTSGSINNGAGEIHTSLEKYSSGVFKAVYDAFEPGDLSTYSHAIVMGWNMIDASSVEFGWGGSGAVGTVYIIYSIDNGLTWSKLSSGPTLDESAVPGSIMSSFSLNDAFSQVRFGLVHTKSTAGKTLKVSTIKIFEQTSENISNWIMNNFRNSETCIDKYLMAKAKILNLGSGELDSFKTDASETIANARQRYTQWAIANGEDGTEMYSSSLSPIQIDKPINNPTISSLLLIGLVGITSLLGYYFIFKKKNLV